MRHEVAIVSEDGERMQAEDVKPEQLFAMYASAAMRLENIEIVLAQTAMLLLNHLGEAPDPTSFGIEDVIADLHRSLLDIHEVIEKSNRMRERMEFLDSRE